MTAQTKYHLLISEKDIWNIVVIFIVCCNMIFCDNQCDGRTAVSIEFFLMLFCSVQTSCIVCLRVKNWAEKEQIFMMLGCTNIVLQKCRTFCASSSSPKHHFSKFLSLLLQWCNKEGTIHIDGNISKSVVFGM